MIQEFANGMITLMLAKFIVNDMPHAVGLLTGSNPDHSYIDAICARCGLPPYSLRREALPFFWWITSNMVDLWLDPSWKDGKVCWYCRHELYEIRVFGVIQTRKWNERWRLLEKIDTMTVDNFTNWLDRLDSLVKEARTNKGLLADWAFKRSRKHRYVMESTSRMLACLRSALISKVDDMSGYRHYYNERSRQCGRHLLSYYIEEWEKLLALPDWWLEE